MRTYTKSKGRKGEHFVMLHDWLLDTPAFRSLCCSSRSLLVELYIRYFGWNNGEISLSVREAAALLNVGRNRPTGLFRELQDRGFIRISKKGSYDQKTRHATTWILTEFRHNDQTPTKDFMSWRPDPSKEGDANQVKKKITQFIAGPATGDRQARREGLSV